MLQPVAMLKVRLLMLASEAQDATLLLARLGSFNPAALSPQELSESTGADYRETWLEAHSRLTKLLENFPGLAAVPLPVASEAPSLDDLRELNGWLKDAWRDCSSLLEEALETDAQRRHLEAIESSLDRLAHLDMDLTPLLDPHSLLNVSIGSLPMAAATRLREALSISAHILAVFDQEDGYFYAVIAGPRQAAGELRGLLSQAGWRELAIPQELRRHPAATHEWLAAQRAGLADQISRQDQRFDEFRTRILNRLQEARVRLALAQPLAQAALSGVRGRGALVAVAGWVPKQALGKLRTALDARFRSGYWLSVEAPQAAESASVPSLVHYPRWLQTFVPLVKSYGVPRYGEFNPTLLFACTYLLLFGAMFGDLGHGAVIVLLSLLVWRRLGRLAGVGLAAGGMSMLFGLLYGSVFGYEDIVPALWLSPLHDPLRVLQLALALGVVFVATTLLINLRNRLAARQFAQALFAANGLAGLLFYLGMVGGALSLLGLAELGRASWQLAALAILSMAAHSWLSSRAGLAERSLVTSLETLETGTSLFANTLSFMRVAAFSLNHAALALAVFTLAAGLGQASHGLALVLGNAIIIVLEGGIVAIQALRLMYYEGFSRFFSADGYEFVPLRLNEAEPL